MSNKEKLQQLTKLSQEDKDKFNLMSDMNMWGRREFLGFFGIELLDRVGGCEWAYIENDKSPQIVIGCQYDDIDTIIRNAKQKILSKEQEREM